jgi:hypothetical protein
MILLTAYLAIGASASTEIELNINHSQVEKRAHAWKILDNALLTLKETWDPTSQSFTAWKATHPIEGVTWESLSGKVNLNTITPFLLGQKGFIDTLKGVSVQKFTETRSKNGPATDISFYADMIQPAALTSWYTIHSLWNINTADEDMLESMVAQRTTSSAMGSAVRASVRTFRGEMRRMSQTDWDRVAGTTKAELSPLVTVEPELDVNEVPENLLGHLLNYPNLNVTEPAIKTQILVRERASRPWTTETLKNMLQVADDNLLLCYLGTRTRFLGGTINTPDGQLDWIVYLEGEAPSPVNPRIIETCWRTP